MAQLQAKHVLCLSTGSGSRQNSSSQEPVMNIFDRKAKKLHRDRITVLPDYKVYDYLKEEVGFRMSDRVCDVKRKFEVAVELGCGRGYVSRHLLGDMVGTIYQCELSQKLLAQSETSPEVETYKVVADEEFLPFKDNSIDLFVSSLSLHWVNDLPGCFRQVHNALKNDGCFIGCMFGGDTLFELRVALQLAETEIEGGFGPHVSPFTEAKDIGGLLQRAGFTMLTIDLDEFVISYPTMQHLMKDLKGMAENNCAWSRRPMLHRDTMKNAEQKYVERFGNDKGVPATYQVLYFIAWKPDPTQSKAAMRGSGQVSIQDLDKLDDIIKEYQEMKGGKDPGNDR
ncbi:hypothetical protein ScPMuIL_014020 [Solemya velum]